MKVNEYFYQLKQEKMSTQRKEEIFSKIQKNKYSQIKFTTYYSYKKVIYTMITLLLISCIFGEQFITTQTLIENHLFRTEQLTPLWAFANNIAEIVEVKGEYYIQQGETIVTSKYIQPNNLLILKDQSEMVFHLIDGTQAKIIGPAECIITQNDTNPETYKINLLQWNFLKIYNENPKNDIEIVTEDISVSQEKANNIDLQIIKKEQQIIIDNKGQDTKITTKQSKKVVLKENETAKIEENNINIEKNNQEVLKYLEENHISPDFSLEKEGFKTFTPEEVNTIISEVSTIIEEINSGNTSENTPLELNEKRIPNEEEEKMIINLLDDFFLEYQMNDIAKTIDTKNQEKIWNKIKILLSNFNNIITVCNLPISKAKSLEDMQEKLPLFKEALQKQYYISPSLFSNIDILTEKVTWFQVQIHEIETSAQVHNVAYEEPITFNQEVPTETNQMSTDI